MGFFKSLFGRDWRKHKKKGDDYAADEEWGRARGSLMEALRLFDGEEAEKTGIEEKLALVHRKLLDMHLTEAERFGDQAMSERALDHLNTALEFATGEGEREDVLARINKVGHAAAVAMNTAPEPAEPEGDEEPGDPFDDEETFLVHLGRLSPEQADLYETLGDDFRRAFLALEIGKLEEAETHLTPVMARQPDNVYLKYEMGRLRLAQERYQEAEDLLREAAGEAPDMISVRHVRVQALWGLEDWDTAERVVEEAFEIDDEMLDNFLIAGQTCLRSGEYENGVEIVEAGTELHARSLPLHRLLGQLQASQGNNQAALDAFETAIRMRWNYNYETGELSFDMESALMAANLYLSERINLPRAEELYRSMLATGEPLGKLTYLVGAGQALMLQNEEDDAREFLIQAATLAEEGSHTLHRIEAIMAGEPDPGPEKPAEANEPDAESSEDSGEDSGNEDSDEAAPTEEA